MTEQLTEHQKYVSSQIELIKNTLYKGFEKQVDTYSGTVICRKSGEKYLIFNRIEGEEDDY